MGGKHEAKLEAVRFVRAGRFAEVCLEAGWDPLWVRDIIDSILELQYETEDVRRDICQQAANMMRKIAKEEPQNGD